MKYKRCCACDFWVTTGDTRCPNCGILEPRADRNGGGGGMPMAAMAGGPGGGGAGDTLTMESPMTDGTRAAFGGFIGAIIGGFLMDGMGVAVGVAVGVSLGVLLGADREWSTAPPGGMSAVVRRPGTGVSSLRQDEETIQQRLTDIASREKRLADARQKVSFEMEAAPSATEESHRWDRVRAALDSAGQILSRQRERYHAKLWEIALVRWQNTLEPLAADWEVLTHEACNHRLRLLQTAVEKGEGFLKDWEGVDLSDLPEGQRCVERLKDALSACAQLREALIVQQAALAVKGIAPMDDALAPHLAPTDSLKSLDLFNARAAIGEFSSAFGELEAEYARLRSEEELAERSAFVQRLR